MEKVWTLSSVPSKQNPILKAQVEAFMVSSRVKRRGLAKGPTQGARTHTHTHHTYIYIYIYIGVGHIAAHLNWWAVLRL